MTEELDKKITEFNRYFVSANGVDVPARVSVPRDEWRELLAALTQSQARVTVPGNGSRTLKEEVNK